MALLNRIPMSISLFLTLLLQGCLPTPILTDFPYQLDSATQTFELPMALKEISGITLGFDEKMLVAVEDETGRFFTIDKTNGAVVKEVTFWKDGDYEDVEVVNGEIYAVKSNGNIYRIQKPATPEQVVVKYESPLSKACDVEGLAHEPAKNRLLLSCKGNYGGVPKSRAVLSFDLKTLTYDTIPVYTIHWDSIVAFIRANPTLDRWEKLQEVFDPSQPELSFSPSALAIHPINGQLYLLSSVGKLLLVLDRQSGEILYIQKLSKKVHPQPEGLCFDADGTMYISNEGKEGLPLIHRFSYQPKK